jgi:hypothetical protein
MSMRNRPVAPSAPASGLRGFRGDDTASGDMNTDSTNSSSRFFRPMRFPARIRPIRRSILARESRLPEHDLSCPGNRVIGRNQPNRRSVCRNINYIIISIISMLYLDMTQRRIEMLRGWQRLPTNWEEFHLPNLKYLVVLRPRSRLPIGAFGQRRQSL